METVIQIETLCKMPLHSTISIEQPTKMKITRVPGGWVYRFPTSTTLQSSFVPLPPEQITKYKF